MAYVLLTSTTQIQNQEKAKNKLQKIYKKNREFNSGKCKNK